MELWIVIVNIGTKLTDIGIKIPFVLKESDEVVGC